MWAYTLCPLESLLFTNDDGTSWEKLSCEYSKSSIIDPPNFLAALESNTVSIMKESCTLIAEKASPSPWLNWGKWFPSERISKKLEVQIIPSLVKKIAPP